LLLVVEGTIALYLGAFNYRMDISRLQTFMLLVLVFTSQFRVLSVRERKHFWSSKPGTELVISSAGAIVGFFLLGVFGVIIPSLSLTQVLVALLLSAAFTLGVDIPKYYVFKVVKLGS
jgi:H+-transporting ATPase